MIHPTALVDPGAEVAATAEVGPHCVIGAGVILEDGVRLIGQVSIEGPTRIGAGTLVHPFAVLGGAPQHAGDAGEGARLEIGPRNVIREHVTMHRGTKGGLGVTRVGSGGYFMAGSHVGHDCQVGENVTLANNAVLGGHAEIGDGVMLGGQAAVHQRARVGRCAFIGGMAGVKYDVIPFAAAWGNHAELQGLNLVGLKRRGFSRAVISQLQAGLALIFAEEGALSERLVCAAERFAGAPEVMEIVDFIRTQSGRPLTTPPRRP